MGQSEGQNIAQITLMYYQGRLTHVIGFFTLHGVQHRAWYTLAYGWCEIPVNVPLNQLGKQGELRL